MPNWCFNNLNIDSTTEGGKILADAFKPKYEDENDEYARIYAKPMADLMPIPEDLQISAIFGTLENDPELAKRYADNIAKYGHAHWYDWCLVNWGTKWDCRVEDFNDDDPKDVYVSFETAWTPPIEFLKWFVEKYPDTVLDMEYSEEGMFFEGRFNYSPDKGITDESWEPTGEEEMD